MLQLYSIFHLNIAYSSIEEEQRPEVNRGLVLRFNNQYKPQKVSGQGPEKVSEKEGYPFHLILYKGGV